VTHDDAQAPARNAFEARLAGWLLALAALIGAASGVLAARAGGFANAELPPGVAASVDGRPILVEDYQRAVEMLAGDRREPLGARETAGVLERLIDEDLLIASALSRGFLVSERSVRDAVLLAMIESVVAESTSREPTPEELRASFDAAHAAARERGQPLAPAPDALAAASAERARALALRAYLDELRGRARIGCADGGAR